MKHSLVLAYLVAAGSTLGACGGGSGETTGDAGPDTGREAGNGHEGGGHPEAGQDGPSTNKYPAFPVDSPQVQKNQGAVLTSPVIVTVTWPQDGANADTWEALGDAIGASPFWSATTGEYGVGKATSGATNHVRMLRRLPSIMSYYDVAKVVTAALSSGGDGGTPEGGSSDGGADAGPKDPPWPAPATDAKGNVQTIYSLFIPQSTTVTDPGTGMPFCPQSLGWHDDAFIGGKYIPYSVSLECPPGPPGATPTIEETAVHEYIEAATDPYNAMTGSGSPPLGYIGLDANHLAWTFYAGVFGGSELADLCQNFWDSYYLDTAPFPYWVQRSWSNKAALAGLDPCAPQPTAPYYGMTLFPAQESKVTLDLSMAGSGKATTLGFKATLGKPTSFEVGFYSTAAVPAWTISSDVPTSVLDTTSFKPISNGTATVKIDKPTGKNGDKAKVTVTPTKAGDAGFQVMAITWDAQTTLMPAPHYLPFVILNE